MAYQTISFHGKHRLVDLGAQGELDEALEVYQKGLNILQTLADQNPSNSVRQKNLSDAKLLTNADVAVTEVVPGSLAESLGIKVGDLLISYDGHKILNSFVLPSMMARTGGEPREVRLRRGGQEMTFTVPPGRLGMRIASKAQD